MSSAAKRRGSQWELDLLKWFRSKGMKTERLRLVGKLDEGDLAVDDVDMTYVIEAKNVARMDIANFLDQALIERDHYAKARYMPADEAMPLAVIKRRGRPIEDAYVVTTLKEFFTA